MARMRYPFTSRKRAARYSETWPRRQALRRFRRSSPLLIPSLHLQQSLVEITLRQAGDARGLGGGLGSWHRFRQVDQNGVDVGLRSNRFLGRRHQQDDLALDAFDALVIGGKVGQR